ncbi:MAG: S1 RNA-binding domain-containing protein, partial [Patescibacteria group bacterium]|nr:S1 RNA-binding domain-containing protein [Patescibacteria group bacterium]
LTMADLMKSVKTSFVTLHKGENLKGTVKKLTSSEILVDVNAKTDAVVLEKDKRILRTILSNLKVGDKVTVSVLNPESDAGNPVVSLRRFIDEMLWTELSKFQDKKEQIEVVVNEATKGGFLVSTESGMKGFLPNSYATLTGKQIPEAEDEGGSQNFAGRKIMAYVLEINKPNRKIIFSQKPVVSEKDFEDAVKTLKSGQKISATVSNVTPFGVFVTVEAGKDNADSDKIGVDGLVHISEISWDKVDNPQDLFSVGQKIDVFVIGVDATSKRIDLSIKRLTVDPFEEISKKYKVDQKVNGVVYEVSPTGVSINLGEDGAEGFIRREKIPPTVSYNVGDKIDVLVTQIDTRKRKILLVPVLREKFVGYK